MKKEITMSIPQFMQLQRGEKTLKDIKEENQLESLATKIINNDRLRRMTVFTIASLNYISTVQADVVQATGKINNAGLMFFGILQTIGYWLCLIGCVMEILKNIMNGSSKDIGKVMLKYILVFATLYIMPFAFDLIKEVFA